jgi:hypothetical protein
MIGATPFSIDDCFEDIGTLAILLLLTRVIKGGSLPGHLRCSDTDTFYLNSFFRH